MLYYKIGNLLDAPQKIIAHQVNCKGKMGSGIAKQIREKYPIVYEQYMQFYNWDLEKGVLPKTLGGQACFIKVNDNREVVNLYGQVDYGYDGKRYTNYALLSLALNEMFYLLKENGNTEVAIPYKMGCDRGGADWNIVEKLLEDFSNLYGVDVYIYSLNNY